MRQIPLTRNTAKYQLLLKSKEADGAGLWSAADLAKVPAEATVVTGDKPDMGGGPSPYAFVIQSNKIVGRVRVEGKDVANGFLTAP